MEIACILQHNHTYATYRKPLSCEWGPSISAGNLQCVLIESVRRRSQAEMREEGGMMAMEGQVAANYGLLCRPVPCIGVVLVRVCLAAKPNGQWEALDKCISSMGTFLGAKAMPLMSGCIVTRLHCYLRNRMQGGRYTAMDSRSSTEKLTWRSIS